MKRYVVSLIMLLALFSSAYSNEEIAYIYADAANLRSGPSTKSSIIGKFRIGTQVKIKERKGDWVRCSPYEGRVQISKECEGWVHHSTVIDYLLTKEVIEKQIETTEDRKEKLKWLKRLVAFAPNDATCWNRLSRELTQSDPEKIFIRRLLQGKEKIWVAVDDNKGNTNLLGNIDSNGLFIPYTFETTEEHRDGSDGELNLYSNDLFIKANMEKDFDKKDPSNRELVEDKLKSTALYLSSMSWHRFRKPYYGGEKPMRGSPFPMPSVEDGKIRLGPSPSGRGDGIKNRSFYYFSQPVEGISELALNKLQEIFPLIKPIERISKIGICRRRPDPTSVKGIGLINFSGRRIENTHILDLAFGWYNNDTNVEWNSYYLLGPNGKILWRSEWASEVELSSGWFKLKFGDANKPLKIFSTTIEGCGGVSPTYIYFMKIENKDSVTVQKLMLLAEGC